MKLLDVINYIREKSKIEIQADVFILGKNTDYWEFQEIHQKMQFLYSEIVNKSHEKRKVAIEDGIYFEQKKVKKLEIETSLDKEFYTGDEVMGILKIRRTTLFKYNKEGKLNPIKEEGKKRTPFLRYSKEEINRYLQNRGKK